MKEGGGQLTSLIMLLLETILALWHTMYNIIVPFRSKKKNPQAFGLRFSPHRYLSYILYLCCLWDTNGVYSILIFFFFSCMVMLSSIVPLEPDACGATAFWSLFMFKSLRGQGGQQYTGFIDLHELHNCCTTAKRFVWANLSKTKCCFVNCKDK